MRAKNPQTQPKERIGPSGRTLAAALLAAVSAGALQSQADAQTPASEAATSRISFDIAAQPLASALSEFARQSGVQILYPYDQLRSISAPSVRGQFSRDEALAQLLAGSGYAAIIDGAGAVRLENRDRPQRVRAETQRGEETREAIIPDTHAAEAVQEEASSQEEIVVTGTRIRGAVPAGANVMGLDRGEIEQSGRTTIQDVLQTLPQVFPGSQSELTQLNSLSPGRNLALGSTVDLRGLGADATLALLNGRRLAPGGLGNFVDISAIPVAAIERVEVLADGASATYGADAVGGVVNIILRRDLDGAETSARYGFADGGMSEWGFSHVLGEAWTTGSFIAGYEYRQRDELEAADRAFSADSDLRPFGGSNFSRTNSNPGNIIRVGATPVTFAIPEGQDGLTLTMADLIAGQTNFQNSNEGAFLLPEQESHSLFTSVRQEITPSIELFLDVLASDRDAHAEKTQTGAIVSVPETNYYRQQAGLFPGAGPIFVGYFFGDDLGPIEIDTRSRTLTAAGGATIDIFSDWRLEASLAYGAHADENGTTNALDSTALPAVLASSDPATAFNPFGAGSNTPASVLQGLTQSQFIETDSELVTYSLKADGGLFYLPGGRARMALGAERRIERFSVEQDRISASGVVTHPLVQAPGRRTVDALFGELFLPLLDERAGLPLVDALTLSLSARREDSSDFGSATTPKVGVQWRLSPDLTLRGTWGTSFKAPQFTQMLTGVGATIGPIPAVFDPNATNGSTGTLQLLGANPDLAPEEAENWTAGFDFESAWAPRLRLSATYFDIDFSNRISTPGSILDAFRNPQNYAGYFIANPTPEQIAAYLALADVVSGIVPPDGIEVIWDERLTNLASLRVRGVDLAANYTFESALGEVSLFASASGLLQFTRRSNPALAAVDVLDTINNPVDWRGRAGASFTHGNWRGALVANYVDDYRDNLSVPNRRIASWTTYDARLTRNFTVGGDDLIEISLDVRNLSDEDPPFANNPVGMGFDTINASPVGRVVMLEARRRW